MQKGEEVIKQSVLKYRQSVNLANKLKFNEETSDKFIISNLLDYFLTQISPATIAEYHNARDKGKI